MSVRKITFARVDSGLYVNRETGVEIIRGAPGVWYVWSPALPYGSTAYGSHATLTEARRAAWLAAQQAIGAISAAHDEALDINAQREIDEAAEWQATPAYRHFARATLVGKGYRAALDILHDEALIEDRRRATLQSRWDVAARRAQDAGRVPDVAAAHDEAADRNARHGQAYQHFADAARKAGGYRAALDILRDEALDEGLQRHIDAGPPCTRECIIAQPHRGGHIASCPRKAYVLSWGDDAIRWPHDAGRMLSVREAHGEALIEDAQRYAARLYDVPLFVLGGPRPTAADALRRVLDALGRGVSPSHVVAVVAEEIGVEL